MYAATRGPNVKWGAQISNGGPGTTGLPAGDRPDPHMQEFEQFFPLPPRTLLTRICPANHPNSRPPGTFSVSNLHLSENY